MTTERWSGVLTRITRNDACEVDEIAGAFDSRRNPIGRPIFPEGMAPLMPQTAFKVEETACIGVRMTEPRENLTDMAMHLTTLALEKNVEIVVLSHLPYSGLERFGFRCERVAGDTEEARVACEEQLCRFWNIEIVI